MEKATGPWRILDVLQWGTAYLTKHEITQPRLSMELMLSKVLATKRLDLYLQFERPLNAAELAQLKALVQKRVQHVPVQHLLGEWEFYGLVFGVSQHVLIPRPETEILVESLLKQLQNYDTTASTNGLDLGTGSGNIAVAMLTHLAECRCVAIDLSLKALKQAQANAQRHGVYERIEFLHGSWFEPLQAISLGRFDWIASNPPYIAKEQWDSLPEEVRRYEPRISLWAGEQGLDCYRVIVARAPKHLKAGGWLALELGAGQSQAVRAQVEACRDLRFHALVNDLNGIERVLLAQRA